MNLVTPHVGGTTRAPERLGSRAIALSRDLPWVIAFAVASVGAVALLLWVGRDLTFVADEHSFISGRELTIAGLLEPHNEHWSALLVLVYVGMVKLVGTAAYWPYLLVLAGLHVAVCALVFAHVRRYADVRWALGASLAMLFLGSGGENLLWAFQIGFVGTMALGLGALYVAARSPWAAALLLTLAVATTGIGLFYVVAVGVLLAIERPRALLWLALPAVVYVAWYLTYGAAAVGVHRAPSFDDVPYYVVAGIVGALGSAIAGWPGAGFVGALVVAAIAALGRGPIPTIVPALVWGVITEFVIIGTVRAQLGHPAESRYLYIAAPALLIAVALLLARLRQKNLALVVGAAMLGISLAGNLQAFGKTHDAQASTIACEIDPTCP